MTAVRGTFADAKSIKTRGVYQLIIEIPLESADHALAVLGGVPQPKAEQWVGIAPVTAPEQPQTAEEAERLLLKATETPQEPEQLKGGARAKRAGILCGDETFQRWLFNTTFGKKWINDLPPEYREQLGAPEAAGILRWQCKTHRSRAELDHNEEAGRIFDRIVDDYYASQRGETPEALAEQRNAGR